MIEVATQSQKSTVQSKLKPQGLRPVFESISHSPD